MLQDLPLLPRLQLRENGWHLSADGMMLLTSPMKSASVAVEAWFASFWVLTIEYLQGLKGCCAFMEKALLRVPGRATAATTKWANRLLRKQ